MKKIPKKHPFNFLICYYVFEMSTPMKIVLIGDGGVGKSAYLKKLVRGNFEKRYIATIGVDVVPLSVVFEDGTQGIFNVWDCAGQEKFGGLRDGYYVNADAFIVMCDASSRLTTKSVDELVRQAKRVCGDHIPFVYAMNKSDLQEKTNPLNPSTHSPIEYIRISVKNSSNLLVPFEKVCGKKIAEVIQIGVTHSE
jgi:GTP-binding nuclear protein Ran